MVSKRTVLLVEDAYLQYAALKQEFEGAGWQVLGAADCESAVQRFEKAETMGDVIDAVALDLGLPPDIDNPLREGIPLAKFIREFDEALPILAYTSLSPRAVNFAAILEQLLPLRVSFVCVRHLGGQVKLAEILEMVWQGYVIFSPTPADYLPHATAAEPDPLTTALWETLKLLSDGYGDKEIAQALPSVGEAGVKARLVRVREILSDIGAIPTTDRQDLITWYKRYHTRYHRD